jgi:hypothetical protein
MAALETYISEWEQDAEIEKDKLDHESLRQPLLHARWWKKYSTERLRWRKQDEDFKLLYRQKWEYFLNKMDDAERQKLGWPPNQLKVLSTNVDTYIEADEDIRKAALTRAYTEEVLRFLEDVIKQINNRGYHIKNAIDFMRFSQGQ